MKSTGLDMGKKIKGCKKEDLVSDYYNTILHYSDYIYTTSILYGVENQMIYWPGGEGNQRPGGKKSKATQLYSPLF